MLIPPALQRELMAVLWGILAVLCFILYAFEHHWGAAAGGILTAIFAILYFISSIHKNKENHARQRSNSETKNE